MTKKKQISEVARQLNLVGPEACRNFIQLQCYLFHYWDKLWDMIEDGATEEELHHCWQNWRDFLKSKVLECGLWNERVFELSQQAIPGLEAPDVPAMIEAMRTLYDSDEAGVK